MNISKRLVDLARKLDIRVVGVNNLTIRHGLLVKLLVFNNNKKLEGPSPHDLHAAAQ